MEVMEVGGNLDVFNCKNSPLDQDLADLILKLVLKHVGKTDIDDLLACRLVNHSWNRAAVYELEQHGYAVELNHKKMVKFRSLLWKSRMSRRQFTAQSGGLPLLTDHHPQLLASLRLSLIIDVVENNSKQANEMGEAAQLLMLYPDLRISFINCSYDASFTGSDDLLTNHELFNVLSLTASTLRSIRISVRDMEMLESPSFEEFEFEECFGLLEFPQLTSLRYQLFYCDTHANDMVDTTRHVLCILKNAPNLTNLHLKVYEGNVDKSASCLQKLIQPCAANLEQLTVLFDHFGDDDDDDIIKTLNALSKIKFPKLIRLNLSSFVICADSQQFTQHLKANCPALTQFVLNSVWIVDAPEGLAGLLLEFPVHENITHFGFNATVPVFMRPERLESVHATFSKMMAFYPGLIEMRLGLGVLVMLEAHLDGSGQHGQLIPSRDQFPIFPNISTLEVKISNNDNMLPLMKSASCAILATRIYHHTFPNIQQLVIELPKTSFRDSHGKEKEQMTHAIEFLSHHPEIRAIDIHNYAQPLLEQMAEAELHWINWEGFSGVKSLKMFPPKKTGECPQLNLLSIVAQFPKLEFLQYGKARIYKTQLETIRYSFNIMKNPISKFRKKVSPPSSP